MKVKSLICACLIALGLVSCGTNLKDKAKQVIESVQTEKEPEQNSYSEALSVLNESLAEQTKLVDEAQKAVDAGDMEKAKEILTKIKSDENATENQKLESMLSSSELDETNKLAWEEYQKKAAALSDKIVSIVTATLDID